jgi:putative PIN family toxin of toxin-antitoxin system
MRVVLDTNVILQGLRNKNGASGFILEQIRVFKLELVISIPVFNEYQDVLSRKKSLELLGVTKKDIDSVLDFLALVATRININFLMRPNLRDESDNMFVDLAFASRANYLVTSNLKDFKRNKELNFDSFGIRLPSDFVKIWRKLYE